MALLHKAVGMGYRNAAAFRTEDALDPLRDRPDFRLLDDGPGDAGRAICEGPLKAPAPTISRRKLCAGPESEMTGDRTFR